MPEIRVLCSAGAPMDRSLLKEVREIFPNAAFFNNYGMTEAAPRISWIRDDDPRFAEPTCGRPMRGVEVKIIDPETGRTLPEGEVGVLAIRGPNITSGYLNDPELTAQAFTPDGYIISGDMARLDDGYIYVSGRHDDIFNCGGEKIAPQEIEDVLNQHAAVDRAAVAGFPDPQRGKAPVAFLKLRRPVTRRDLVEYLSGELTRIKIPQRFLHVTGFPMTPNGKLQRRLLSLDDGQYIVGEIE
jgi:acyl-CoA synthetase (AMP-forming)/AMP-acid ligase II